jgi:hypothetical protein
MGGNIWTVAGGGHKYEIFSTHPTREGTVAIVCTVESSPEINFVVADLSFRFKPLRVAKSSLVVGLYTDEPKGALVEVEAIPVPPGFPADMLDVALRVHRDDTPKLLRALTSGKDLHFLITNAAPPRERPFLAIPIRTIAHLMLYNDDTFKSLYEQTVERILISQDATRARQLSEGWYRRRTRGVDA